MNRPFAALAAALLLVAGAAGAQSSPEEILRSLDYREGTISIPEAHATLQLNDDFRFLGRADARRVLEDLWGNPEDDSVLGLLVPTADGLGTEHSWAVMLTWNAEGYVSDEDAAEIDYAELLEQMKEAQEAANPELQRMGYSTATVVGWAESPRYDATGKRLHWARHLQFHDAPSGTLNYDIRVLGREGFLSMNAIADIGDLARVKAGMDDVLGMASFEAGHRYEDFNAATDRTAAYGLAALVGGGLAAKTGLLAKLGILLAKGWKLLLIGGFVLVAAGRKLFGRKERTVS